MFKLNDRKLPLDTPFTYNDIQYPANWLRLSSQEERAALGIIEEQDVPRQDDRFYWNGDIDLPKNLDDADGAQGLKSQWKSQVKSTAGSLLAQTDWMIIRKFERGTELPETVAEFRSSVITEASRLETAIDECTTVEELIAVVSDQQWPSQRV